MGMTSSARRWCMVDDLELVGERREAVSNASASRKNRLRAGNTRWIMFFPATRAARTRRARPCLPAPGPAGRRGARRAELVVAEGSVVERRDRRLGHAQESMFTSTGATSVTPGIACNRPASRPRASLAAPLRARASDRRRVAVELRRTKRALESTCPPRCHRYGIVSASAGSNTTTASALMAPFLSRRASARRRRSATTSRRRASQRRRSHSRNAPPSMCTRRPCRCAISEQCRRSRSRSSRASASKSVGLPVPVMFEARRNRLDARRVTRVRSQASARRVLPISSLKWRPGRPTSLAPVKNNSGARTRRR